MNAKIIDDIAMINSETPLITNTQTALDLIASIDYKYNITKIAINKSAIDEDFFDLSTGLAGEVVQKFINYGYKFAIIGGFSKYTSKSLHDYIYECNSGKHPFFVSSEEEATERLG